MPWTAYKTHNINYVTIEKEVGKVQLLFFFIQQQLQQFLLQ